MTRRKKVMVFGTFDGLHEGHRYFLNEVRKLGGYLIVVVAHDEAVRQLKKREPRLKMGERVAAIQQVGLADQVVIGDAEQGGWEILKQHEPDLIAIGHDQQALRESLKTVFKGKIVVIGQMW